MSCFAVYFFFSSEFRIMYNSEMQEQIQRSQKIQPSFIVGGTRYNLSASTWKQQKFRSSYDNHQKFMSLDEFQYAIIKSSMYVLLPSSNNPNQSSLHSYNFITEEIKQWKSDEDSNTPVFRQKYAMTSFDGRICIFAGYNDARYFNDIVSFCSYSNMWVPVLKAGNKVAPEPRIPFVFTEISGGNLLVFGGKNQKGVLKDAYLMVDFTWKQLSIANAENIQMNLGNLQEVTKPQGIRYAPCRNSVYFFGGFDNNKFLNQFFQLRVGENNNQIIIKRITEDTGPRPCARAYHSMQRLGENCIAVYGGLNGVSSLRDFSIYDVLQHKWVQIFPLNGPIPLLGQPKMYYQGHSLHIMGISSEKNNVRKNLVELSFPQFQVIKSQICHNCVKRIENKQRDEISAPKKPFISNGLIYNMAMQISFPFQALSLLLDCVQAMSASQVSIRNQETTNKLSYIDIRFDGKPLSRQQYYSLISHSYENDKLVLQIIDKLKLGALRLGKTLIYVSIYEGMRRVFLFSADSLIISHYHEIYAYLAYEQRVSDQWLSTQQSINHKKFIMNLLQSYFVNPSQVINQITHHCFLIFESNVLMTTEKIYYGQLISTAADITLCKSNKKVQFLDSIGFKLAQDPQVSLSTYLSYLYLTPTLTTLKIQQTVLHPVPNRYLNELQHLQQALQLKPLLKQKVQLNRIEAQCTIYEVIDPTKYIKQLRGILLYYNGRLINRLDISFGDLFWNKFYKNKYKKCYGIWDYVGVVDFQKGVQVKTAGNQFRNDCGFVGFIRYLKKEVIGKQQAPRIAAVGSQIEQQGKSTKPSKRQR